MARLLVAHDSADVLHVLGAVLNGEGFDVHSAHDKAELLDILKRESFDLIVTDYRGLQHPGKAMAWMTWLETLLASARGAPVLLLTTSRAVAQCSPTTLGVVDIVLEPFDVVDLVSRVRAATTRR